MTPDQLTPGMVYPAALPDYDCSLFEFPKSGPELRLFYADIPDGLLQSIQHDTVYLGLLRYDGLGVVPWKIGDQLQGDAQFHVMLYPPETRPSGEVLPENGRFRLQVTLIDRSSGKVCAVRHVDLSRQLSTEFSALLADQLGDLIEREAYDAKVSAYQTLFRDLDTVIQSARHFDQAQD